MFLGKNIEIYQYKENTYEIKDWNKRSEYSENKDIKKFTRMQKQIRVSNQYSVNMKNWMLLWCNQNEEVVFETLGG